MTRIAAYQGWSHPTDIDSNAELIQKVMSDAAANSIRFLVFPEMFLTGYMIWDELPDLSMWIDDKRIEAICAAARAHGIVTVLGLPEARDDHRCSNSAIVIDDDGRIAGVHRKVHLFRDESSVFASGEQIDAFPTAVGKVGVAICYDIEFPEMARELALAGADIIAVSTANMVPFQHMQGFTIQSRAWENGIPIALANYQGSDDHYEYFGDSCIVDSDGTVVARATKPMELIWADLNLDESPSHRASYLSRRRPEIYGRMNQPRPTGESTE
jgi:predicted amidohydrolase